MTVLHGLSHSPSVYLDLGWYRTELEIPGMLDRDKSPREPVVNMPPLSRRRKRWQPEMIEGSHLSKAGLSRGRHIKAPSDRLMPRKLTYPAEALEN